MVALDDVTFALQAGQTLAIFGPNGAGKTTLLKVLAGLIRPDAGRATVAGGRGAIGWIGHQSHLYGHLSVRENLLFWAALYRVPAATRAERAAQVMQRLGIAQHAERPVWVLSRFDACWRWLRNRPDSPWYPAARIFGQPAPGDWTSVIAKVARELERVTP